MSQYAITQHIPVANHVYKFLLKRCGTDHIKATRRNFIGSLLVSLHSRTDDLRKAPKNDFKKMFHIEVPFHIYEKNGVYIDERKAYLFNTLMDDIFREELFVHAIIQKNQEDKLFLKTLRNFLDVYDITEDDLKLETIYRDFKRKKKQYENNLAL